MKTLVVHNNNVSNIDSYDVSIKFTSITDTLETLESKEFDVIYIKDNLTLNCLDFLGIELAYHIRFTQKFKYILIVILSDLDGFTLSKLTSKAQILLTKNTFFNQAPKSFPVFDDTNYKSEFLDKITIERPKDTSGDHDIANQWAIYRWAEFLNITDREAIKINKNKIFSLLYFKYLLALKSIIKTDEKLELNYPNKSGTILYIDDQWNMGWQDIYNKLFSNNNIDFKTIKEVYKTKSSVDIQSFTKQYIRDINPDLVILDLRLHSDDNVVGVNDEELNGIKILKYIKQKVNPGIQVILLTASGKSTILDTANKYNILGYIKKEHPSDHSITTQEKLSILSSMVENGLNKKYLKSIYTNMKQLKKILDNNPFSQYITNSKKYKDYNDKLKLEISYIYNILDSNTTNKYPYAMLSITSSLEAMLSIFITEKNNSYNLYWDGEDCRYTTIEDKMINFLNKKLGYKEDDIKLHDLIQRRNSYVHSNSNYKDVTKDEIARWFELLLKILKIIENPPNYIVYDKDAKKDKIVKNFKRSK